MPEKSYGELQLRGLVLALGHRAAAAAGALTAFVSLLHHVPVRVACMRGGLAWLALIALARATRWLCTRTCADPKEGRAAGAEAVESGRQR